MSLRSPRMGHFLLGLVTAFAGIVVTVTQAEVGLPHPLVEAAREQIGVTMTYDPGYATLDYPNGDIPRDRGVCTDVVIRAYRDAFQKDLQVELHRDMRSNFARYPKIWGLQRPDRNIDHRRVPNLQRFFERQGAALGIPENNTSYQPGDLVSCIVPPNLPHIMIVSDRTNAQGVPLVIHNIGSGTREEDRLEDFEITGHYRWPTSEPSQ
ncbi:MAG: DUF1287 domain-containing protein [Verrucomicrobiales bacterium]